MGCRRRVAPGGVAPLSAAAPDAVVARGRFRGGWGTLHLLNLTLHAVNSLLVAVVASQSLGRWPAVVAGAVFATFPGSTEAVVWNAGVFDLMATCSALVSVALWQWSALRGRKIFVLIPVFIAGLLSKETAIVTPALLLLATLAAKKAPLGRSRSLALLSLVLVGAGIVAARLVLSPHVAAHLHNLPLNHYQWKELVVRPFAGVAVPYRTDQGVGADIHVAALALLCLLVVLVVDLSLERRREATRGERDGQVAAVRFGTAWILISALPLLLAFHVSPSMEGNRVLYLPSAGLAFVVSAAFARGGGRGAFRALLLLSVLAVSAVRLHAERQVWLDAASLRDAVLASAESIVRSVPCASLSVHGAPDNHRGVYVFREGLDAAAAALPLVPAGEACELTWTGSRLERIGADRDLR